MTVDTFATGPMWAGFILFVLAGELGQYLKRTDPGFSPKAMGHAALSDMVRTYPDLAMTRERRLLGERQTKTRRTGAVSFT